VLPPERQWEREAHPTGVIRRDADASRRDVRGGLADERDDLDSCLPPEILVTVAGRQRSLMQIEHLSIVREIRGRQRRSVEPGMPGAGAARIEVDAGPPGHERGTGDIPGRVIHERDHVGLPRLRAARCGQRCDVSVADESGKVIRQSLEPDAQPEVGIGGAAGESHGRRQPRAEHGAGKTCKPAQSASASERMMG